MSRTYPEPLQNGMAAQCSCLLVRMECGGRSMQRSGRFGLTMVVLVGCLLVLNRQFLLLEQVAAATATSTQSTPSRQPIMVANAQQVKLLQSVTLSNFPA